MVGGADAPEGTRPISGASGYVIGSDGTVYSFKWGRWRRLKAEPNSNGYLRVTLSRTPRMREFVHRLVMIHFGGPIPFVGAECRHKDDDPSNNSIDNLEWGTHSDNMQDMVKRGRHVSQVAPYKMARGERHGSKTKPGSVPRGESNGNAAITEKHVRAIRSLLDLGFTLSDIARVLGITRGAVKGVANQGTWSHVQEAS